nr:methyl-accepting chemotaxis protein [Desulfovibrio sp.]
MQKLFGLALMLSFLTICIGSYSLMKMQVLAADLQELYEIHLKGLDLTRLVNITVLQIVRDEKNLIISTSDEDNQKYLEALKARYSILDKQINSLPDFYITKTGQEMLARLVKSINEWRAVHNQVIKLSSTTDPEMNRQGQQLSDGKARELVRNFTQAVQDVADLKASFAKGMAANSYQAFETARIITIAGIMLSVFLGIGLGYWMARNMRRQLGDEPASLSELALSIAGGNLEAQFNPALPDIGVFGAMKQMVTTLKSKILEANQKTEEAAQESEKAKIAMAQAEEARRQAERAKAEGMLQAARQLEGVVKVVSSASEELSAQVEQSSRGADEQSNRVRETATAMEEMNATVLEVAKNAQMAADISTQTKNQALEGSRIVNNAVASIKSVHTQSLAIKEDMDALGQQAEGIGQIMSVIADIADQTNLLALNAAIEAARAGDAGRGFAVVADEVRKLAEKTMTATQEVGQAVQGIQEGTKKNIQNVDNAGSAIEEAANISVTSGESLSKILELVNLVNDQVQSIATASEQQSAASEEINRSVEQVASISEETAQAMEHASRAVADLAQQSQVLQGLIVEMKSAT